MPNTAIISRMTLLVIRLGCLECIRNHKPFQFKLRLILTGQKAFGMKTFKCLLLLLMETGSKYI